MPFKVTTHPNQTSYPFDNLNSTGLISLYNECGMLHRDVSAGNVFLWDKAANNDEPPEEGMHGFLADVEFALQAKTMDPTAQHVPPSHRIHVPSEPNPSHTGAIKPVEPGSNEHQNTAFTVTKVPKKGTGPPISVCF
jgi:hypothetical protein